MSTNRLDLNLVPIAVALYDELNVSRAARKLGTPPPSRMAIENLKSQALA